MIVGTEIMGDVALGCEYYPPVLFGGIELGGEGLAYREVHIIPCGKIRLMPAAKYELKLRTVLNTAVQYLLRELKEATKNLRYLYRSGKSGRMYADINKLFLSGREEEEDYAFPPETLPEGETILSQIMEQTLSIHMKRGTQEGMMDDVERMCNCIAEDITITRHEQLECGWMLDVTSPGFIGTDQYDEDYSLSFLGLDNMIDITMINAGNRSNDEVKKIIRKEMVPAIYNVRCFFELGE